MCKSIVDVGFLIDSSGSLRNEYYKEKEFVKGKIISLNLDYCHTI